MVVAIVLIAIVFLLIATAGFIGMYWKFKEFQDNSNILHQVINDRSIKLESTAAILNLQAREILKMDQDVHEAMKYNRNLLDRQDDLLKKTQIELYNVKESSIWLHDHYQKVHGLAKKLLKDGRQSPEIYSVMDTADHNMTVIENHFYTMFKIYPYQYKMQKKLLHGKNENGSTSYQTNSSIN